MIGVVTIEITDSRRKSAPLAKPHWRLNVEEKAIDSLYYLGPAALLLGLLFIALPAIRARRRKKRREQYSLQRLQYWEQHLEERRAQQAALFAEEQATIEEGGNAFEGEVEQAEAKPVPAKPGGIRIKKVKKATERVAVQHNAKELDKISKTAITLPFPVGTFWEETAVEDIIFVEGALEQLDQFLRAENLRPLQEKEGEIPEVGGLLMGRPFHGALPGTYRVLVEEFIPIAPEYHDTYQLEFSAQSLARDLGDAQDKFPQLTLVGWFHTHPGHGLFLSRPDLRIQDTFFKKPYQFAMEIDSLTERLDTGFFTRMPNGKVNNRRNVPAGKSWFSWIEIGHQGT